MVRFSSALAALCLIVSATALTEKSDDLTAVLSGMTAAPTVTVTSTTKPAGTLTYSGTAAPTQSGVVSGCKEYYLVKDDDTCLTIQSQFMDFTLQQFYKWNPSISSDCEGLKPGYFVCVSDGTMPTGRTSTLSGMPTETANSGTSAGLRRSTTLGLLAPFLQILAL